MPNCSASHASNPRARSASISATPRGPKVAWVRKREASRSGASKTTAGPATFTATIADVALSPLSSVATAVKPWSPGAAIQTTRQGLVADSPTLAVPLKYSIFAMLPSGSRAVAVSSTAVSGPKYALLAGEAMETCGALLTTLLTSTGADVASAVAPLSSTARAEKV